MPSLFEYIASAGVYEPQILLLVLNVIVLGPLAVLNLQSCYIVSLHMLTNHML